MKDIIHSLKLLAITSIFRSDLLIRTSFKDTATTTSMSSLVLGSNNPQNKDCSQVCIKSIGMFRLWDDFGWPITNENRGTSNNAIRSDEGGANENEIVTMFFHQIPWSSWADTQEDILDYLVLDLEGVDESEANHDTHEDSKCQHANMFIFPMSPTRKYSNNNGKGNDDKENDISLPNFGSIQDTEAYEGSQKACTNGNNHLEQSVHKFATLKANPATKNDQDNSCYLVIFVDKVFQLVFNCTNAAQVSQCTRFSFVASTVYQVDLVHLEL